MVLDSYHEAGKKDSVNVPQSQRQAAAVELKQSVYDDESGDKGCVAASKSGAEPH
jgi:hypothetical protein